MKNFGKAFESDFKNACIEQGIDYTRLKDAGWQGESTVRRFTPRNICDCILFHHSIIVFAELKHRNNSLPFKDITQIEDLRKKWNPESGVFSGVVCCLKREVFFISTVNIDVMQSALGKKSFNADDANTYGLRVVPIVPKGKKKVRPHFLPVMHALIESRRNSVNSRNAQRTAANEEIGCAS